MEKEENYVPIINMVYVLEWRCNNEMIRQIVIYILPFTYLNVGHQFKQGGGA